jgi:aminoglycoside phosphotransferase (APT) family kinase protein
MGILEYTSQLDIELKRTLNLLFKQELDIERIKQGEVNYAYKVTDTQGVPLYHARIFRYEGHPDIGKLLWLSEELRKLNIPQASILHIEKSSINFPNGLMVSDWIEGKNGWQSIKDGTYSLKNFTLETAKILLKVHEIKVASFGRLYGKGLGHYNKYRDRIMGIPNDDGFKKLFKNSYLKKKHVLDIINLLLKALEKIPFPEQPILVHSDPTPDNIIVRDDGSLVLVDWDDSEGSWWVRDYSYLRYWSDRPEEIKAGFFSGYGKIDMNDSEIKIAELVEWILQSLRLLPYYKFSFVDEEKFQKRMSRLKRDIKKLKLLV